MHHAHIMRITTLFDRDSSMFMNAIVFYAPKRVNSFLKMTVFGTPKSLTKMDHFLIKKWIKNWPKNGSFFGTPKVGFDGHNAHENGFLGVHFCSKKWVHFLTKNWSKKCSFFDPQKRLNELTRVNSKTRFWWIIFQHRPNGTWKVQLSFD